MYNMFARARGAVNQEDLMRDRAERWYARSGEDDAVRCARMGCCCCYSRRSWSAATSSSRRPLKESRLRIVVVDPSEDGQMANCAGCSTVATNQGLASARCNGHGRRAEGSLLGSEVSNDDA
jgi:hypothetical protein